MTSVDDQIAALAAQVRASPRVIPRGAGTKLRPGDAAAAAVISTAALSGILEYEPTEYTFTALAGTPVRDVQRELEKHGQYLPFDPLLAARGATLGGTVAAAANGPGRLRYGGVRDFIIGLRFIDAEGRLIRGGGKVVKNAAGFDFPKLFCGSFGRLGLMVEFSFKVFPAPAARLSLDFRCPALADALECLAFIAGQPWEAEALEIIPQPDGTVRILARFMGDEPALTNRARVIAAAVGRPCDPAAPGAWDDLRTFSPDVNAVRVPLTARHIAPLHVALAAAGADSCVTYGEAANAAWLRWPAERTAADLDRLLADLGLTGVVLTGPHPALRLGLSAATGAELLVKRALDPGAKFLPF